MSLRLSYKLHLPYNIKKDISILNDVSETSDANCVELLGIKPS